jgi:hypothetical protein
MCPRHPGVKAELPSDGITEARKRFGQAALEVSDLSSFMCRLWMLTYH